MTDDPKITQEQAARLLGTSERNVRRLIQQGRLQLEPDTTGTPILRRNAVLTLAEQSKRIVTQMEAARLLDCGRRTIRRMLDDGRLDAAPTPGGRDRVTLQSIHARLADVPSNPDIIGQKADTWGQADTLGLVDILTALPEPPSAPASVAVASDPEPAAGTPVESDALVALLGIPAAQPPRAPHRAPGQHWHSRESRPRSERPRSSRRVRAAALLALAILMLGTVIALTRVIGHSKDGAPRATGQITSAAGRLPTSLRTHRLHETAGAIVPAKRTARARGGEATIVTHRVRRSPAPQAIASTPDSVPRPRAIVPWTPIYPSRPDRVESACADLYAAEGLC